MLSISSSTSTAAPHAASTSNTHTALLAIDCAQEFSPLASRHACIPATVDTETEPPPMRGEIAQAVVFISPPDEFTHHLQPQLSIPKQVFIQLIGRFTLSSPARFHTGRSFLSAFRRSFYYLRRAYCCHSGRARPRYTSHYSSTFSQVMISYFDNGEGEI